MKKLEQSIIKQTKIQKELQIKIDEKQAEKLNLKEINERNIRIQNEKNRQVQEEAAQARAARNEIVRAESKFLAFVAWLIFLSITTRVYMKLRFKNSTRADNKNSKTSS